MRNKVKTLKKFNRKNNGKEGITLLVYIVQFVKSSDNIAPRSPNNAPEAPTEMLFLMNRDERTLPPNPAIRYIMPIRTANIIK